MMEDTSLLILSTFKTQNVKDNLHHFKEMSKHNVFQNT